jgi:hypothetical protein
MDSPAFFANAFSDEVVLSDDFCIKIISKKEAIDFLGIDPADF